MTLRLILTRHAKSSWDNMALSDHERCLNDRGRRSATAIGGWLARNGYLPNQALVSDAMRTQETWARIAAQLPDAPAPELSRSLYLASEDQMLSALRKASGAVVMMIAHNPGSAFLAEGLVVNAPADDNFRRYPTAATAIIDFNVARWADIGWNTGKVVDFIVPRDLLP